MSMADDVRLMVGRNVKLLRLAAGLTQAALAERMGVDRAYVSGLELGQRNPTILTLWHITKALGVTLKTFFDEEKPRRRASREKN
jgi:transcriptional regulator with XRE-family HTH domain